MSEHGHKFVACSLRIFPKSIPGFDELESWPYFEVLSIQNCGVTPAAYERLRRLPKLRFVVLEGPEFNDDSLNKLGSCLKLEELELYTTSVTKDGIRDFRDKLPNCRIEGWKD